MTKASLKPSFSTRPHTDSKLTLTEGLKHAFRTTRPCDVPDIVMRVDDRKRHFSWPTKLKSKHSFPSGDA